MSRGPASLGTGRVTNEERIVQDFLRPLTRETPEALGLIDDCALLTAEPGQQLVLKTDAVVAGTHFFADDAATDIGFKALAVAVSDLVAKGATPRFWQMTLALPEPPHSDWLTGLCAGFAEVQELTGIRLIGGDLVRTSGPLLISVTAIGSVAEGRMLRRGGGRPGDLVYVSGSIGDAVLGLRLRGADPASAGWPLSAGQRQHLVRRYLRPEPRLQLVPALRRHATGAMDVSDGLVIDFQRLCRASGTGGVLQTAAMPLSAAARTVVTADLALLTILATGGDDYEVLFTVAPAAAAGLAHDAAQAGVAVTQIGALTAGPDIVVLDVGNQPLRIGPAGYEHFSR